MTALRQPLPSDAARRLQPLLAELTDTLRRQDGAAAAEVGERVWAALPQPRERYWIDTVLDRIMGVLVQTGAFDAARRWWPRCVDHMDPDDPSYQLFGGIVHTEGGDHETGRRMLAAAYAARGPAAFQSYPRWLPIARGDRAPAGIDPTTGADPGDDVETMIKDLAASGEAAMDEGQVSRALDLYRQGLALVPDPADGAAVWLHGAIGDALAIQRQWPAARDEFFAATQGDGGMDKPYIQFRLGQCEYELGHLDAAANGLVAAWMTDGRVLFEDEDPKYEHFLRDRRLV